MIDQLSTYKESAGTFQTIMDTLAQQLTYKGFVNVSVSVAIFSGGDNRVHIHAQRNPNDGNDLIEQWFAFYPSNQIGDALERACIWIDEAHNTTNWNDPNRNEQA